MKYEQRTLFDSSDATSSEASAAGSSPLILPAGRRAVKSGPAPVRASHSATPARRKAKPTNGTSGQSSFGSSASADQESSSENKSRRRKQSAEESKAKHRAYAKAYRQKHRAKELIRHAQERSKKKAISFDLWNHLEEIQARIDMGVCEVTGLPLNLEGGRTWDSPSLDRIDPKKEYVYSNIRVVCHGANSAMGDWGENIMVKMAMAIMTKRRERSNDLSRRLGERLQEKVNGLGSLEYKLTWSQLATPSGHVYFRLAARARRPKDGFCVAIRPLGSEPSSALPTSGNGCSGWPTTAEQNADGGPYTKGDGNAYFTLQTAAELTGWATPTVHDGEKSDKGQKSDEEQYGTKGRPLGRQVLATQLGGWPTPQTCEAPNMSTTRENGWSSPRTPNGGRTTGTLRGDNGKPRSNLETEILGATSTSSPAETRRPGASALNPAMARWLQGFPTRTPIRDWDTSSPGWSSWATIQRLLGELYARPEGIESGG